MPIQYAGIRQEHEAVRQCAGLFDVSHMGNFFVHGPDAVAFLQWITTNDMSGLYPGDVQYSALCLPEGGVIDDILVYCLASDSYMIVVNASNIDKDWAWFQEHQKGFDVVLENRSEDTGIISLQGPQAEGILRKLTDAPLESLSTYKCSRAVIAGCQMSYARTGYTGEDGFEFFPASNQAVMLWRALLEAGTPEGLEPVGLGARDTLRLESGYSLYGHELSERINPLEAGLGWITDFDKGDFVGRDALAKLKASGLKRKMTGIEMLEQAIPRDGFAVHHEGRQVGVVTSGTSSPTLGKGIALALVETALAEKGTLLQIEIRGTLKAGKAVNRAFYKRSKAPPVTA